MLDPALMDDVYKDYMTEEDLVRIDAYGKVVYHQEKVGPILP